MFEIGARGYILKSDGFNELEKAISLVLKGEKYSSMNLNCDFNTEFQSENVSDTEREADSKTKLKVKLNFFPWVVKKNKCINFD
jgi:DNA-binding NarL/FixJ family response regulator